MTDKLIPHNRIDMPPHGRPLANSPAPLKLKRDVDPRKAKPK